MKRSVVGWIAIACVGISAAPVHLPLPEADRLASRSVELTLRARYVEARKVADSLTLLIPGHPAGPLFHALTSFARYDDLSEVADLRRASVQLRRADSLAKRLGDPFWMGVTQYELGYELTIWGSEIKGALAIRAGAKQLSQLKENDDAQAMAAIYDYYFSDAMSWIPFVTDQRADAVLRLERGIRNSRYFSALYRTALVWVYWANHEIEKGLAVVEPIVEHYPENRIFLQAKGDLQRKGKRYSEARATYKRSAYDYGRAAPQSVRFLCAQGNLVLIYDRQGDKKEAMRLAAELNKKLPALRDRMPDSLLDELKKLGYIK